MSATTMGPFTLSYRRPLPANTWVAGVAKWIRGVGAATVDAVHTATSSYVVGAFSSAYANVANLVQSFAVPGTNMSVDEEAVKDATEFLGHLIAVNAAPPTVFPTGGDAVVFVWDKPAGKEYAFYSEDIISLTHVPFEGSEWQVDIDLREPAALTSFATYIGR